MHRNQFDALTKAFGERSVSRRRALTRGAAVLAAGAVGGVAGPGRAQEATPEATPDERRKHPIMMFVQTFKRGSIARTDGHDERYTVTLENGVGETIFFSDRPDRIVGTTPTDQFLDGLGFLEDNPPNAAMVVETAPGETDIAVVELFNPVYDPETFGVTYDVEVLAHWQQSLEMEFTEAPTGLAEITPEFGTTQLFIDDCPDYKIFCYYGNPGERKFMGSLGPQDHCFSIKPKEFMCVPCQPAGVPSPWYHEKMAQWDEKCNAALPACQGNCRAVSK